MEYVDPSEVAPEVRMPTDEQLSEGFYLDPTETVAFDIPTSGSRVRRGYNIGNGVIVQGQVVVELELGGREEHALGYVINTLSGPHRRDVLVVHGLDGRAFSASLTRGAMWGIGRRYEGQDFLPQTVSGDHCAVGLDDQGRMVIANHGPTNLTGVRRLSDKR